MRAPGLAKKVAEQVEMAERKEMIEVGEGPGQTEAIALMVVTEKQVGFWVLGLGHQVSGPPLEGMVVPSCLR